MKLLPTFLADRLHRLFLDELLSTACGRATLLQQLADAEGGDGGELDIFGHLLGVIEDAEVKKLVRVHKEDEERHERLLLARRDAMGAAAVTLPRSSHLLRRLDARTGFFSRPITDRAGVVEAYLLLLVIEERAVRQFGRWQEAFRRQGDEVTADVIADISRDEERHLLYCQAISARFSDDEGTRQRRLAQFRALEDTCFAEAQAVTLAFLVDQGFVGHSRSTRALWTMVSAVAKKRIPTDGAKPSRVRLRFPSTNDRVEGSHGA